MRQFYRLSGGGNDFLALAEPADRQDWDRLHLGYTETFGAPALRETIAGRYERVQADELLCFAGAEEGVYAAMHALLTQDDHAVVDHRVNPFATRASFKRCRPV